LLLVSSEDVLVVSDSLFDAPQSGGLARADNYQSLDEGSNACYKAYQTV